MYMANPRVARKDDLAAIVDMLQNDALGELRESRSQDLTPYKQAFDQILSDSNHEILLLEENTTPIACVQISYIPNLTFKGTLRAQFEGIRSGKKSRRH